MTTAFELCESCRRGVGPERFERVAVRPDGPTFLLRCSTCGALWDETLRYSKLLSRSEALSIYPDARI